MREHASSCSAAFSTDPTLSVETKAVFVTAYTFRRPMRYLVMTAAIAPTVFAPPNPPPSESPTLLVHCGR